jgi:hypothetical protein
MNGFRVGQAVIVAFVVVSLGALLVVGGCGAGSTRSAGGAADAPAVTLGGYTFPSNSQNLTHPDLTVNPATPQWVGVGYGSCSGKTMSTTWAAGGSVAGVSTLKMTLKIPLPAEPVQYQWLARDTLGNIHVLQVKTGAEASRLVGVAGGYPAWFWLPRPASMTPGHTWYRVEGSFAPIRITQNRIMSTSATWQGKAGLVAVRMIEDTNHDGVFQTTWPGPDTRRDIYYSPGKHSFYGSQVMAAGGYVISAGTGS